jgi:tRNA A-37 threonylcarbamoyl transferase component Bud32
VVIRSATDVEMARRRPSRLHEPASSRWLLGLLAVGLVAAGALGVASAASTGASTGASASTATQSAARVVAVAATSRISSWLGQVDQELDGYAAAIVSDSTEGPAQLSASFQTLLTGTGDFTLLEFTDLGGDVIAASSGDDIDLVGAGWLADVSATPLVTRISQSGSSLRWFVARRATTGTIEGILVGALDASQVANLLGSVDPGATVTERLDVVLPGRLLLYSSAMTSTLHAGLTDASMIADGALSTRVVSPAVTAALAGGTGVASYSTNGVSTVAGYDSISLPGWEMGVVVTEPSGVVAAAGQGLPGPAWLLPSVALAVGLVLLLALADPRRTRAIIVGPGGRLRQAGAALTPTRLRSGARSAGSGWAANALPPAADLGEAGPTLVHDSSPVAGTPPSRRRRLRGRYEILEVVGSGGEGQVLRALDHLHARQVAIKVRHFDPHDISRRRDILNEASVLLRMTPDPHASVVREDFIVGDSYYLVMDWIDGTPLDRLLGERGDPGLPWAAVLDWMGQVAEVLDHLHGQTPAIVHGDVKPGNVILTSAADRDAILVDFGISQYHEVAPGARAGVDAREVVGSPGFMAPEMLAGAPPSPASDVFSLAATTFALLLGHPPRLGEPPQWRGIDPAIAAALEPLLKTGLAVDPGRRPLVAAVFIASLRMAAGSLGPAGGQAPAGARAAPPDTAPEAGPELSRAVRPRVS